MLNGKPGRGGMGGGSSVLAIGAASGSDTGLGGSGGVVTAAGACTVCFPPVRGVLTIPSTLSDFRARVGSMCNGGTLVILTIPSSTTVDLDRYVSLMSSKTRPNQYAPIYCRSGTWL